MALVKRSAGTALLALALAGCGTPGPPQPPSLNLPNRVEDLAALRTGNRVTLTWTMPRRNTDKLLIKTNMTAQVCRSENAGACMPLAKLSFPPGQPASFEELLPVPQSTGAPRPLTYTVELQNRSGRSAGLSNPAVVLAGDAPAPVTGLAVEVRKSGVVLRWTASENGVAFNSAIRIHRKLLTPRPPAKQSGPLASPPETIDQNLLVDPDTGKAVDTAIVFGNTYEYRVQRIARIQADGHTIELAGEISPSIHVDAQDVFPPAVPTGLAAVATAPEAGTVASIDLNWEPNPEPDLAGYLVYRREDETPWQRVSGEKPLAGPAFHDIVVLPGHTYRYGVSAVDRGGHESGRSAEAKETVPKP
jgi:hypothetical protein